MLDWTMAPVSRFKGARWIPRQPTQFPKILRRAMPEPRFLSPENELSGRGEGGGWGGWGVGRVAGDRGSGEGR